MGLVEQGVKTLVNVLTSSLGYRSCSAFLALNKYNSSTRDILLLYKEGLIRAVLQHTPRLALKRMNGGFVVDLSANLDQTVLSHEECIP